MKLIIAGGRSYVFSSLDRKFLNRLMELKTIDEIVSGGATGADREGENFAKKNKIPIRKFEAGWHFGKASGPIRNRLMAEYADAVVLFPGGKGTRSMHEEAVRAELIIFDRRNVK